MRAALLATAFAFAVLSASAAQSSPLAKAFPAGCWIGKSTYGGTYATGPVKGKVTNGKQTFVLWVGPAGSAVGFLTVTGIGTGALRVAGSELALEVKILGDYDLTGTAADVEVNGSYSMTGTALGTGQLAGEFPVKIKRPVKGVLTIKTVSPQKVTGAFAKAPWSATRRAGAPSKRPDACANAA
jgi:hypothetical protein